MHGVYLSIGVDLRLMEADDFRRTELIKQPELVEARASEWKSALLETAWSISAAKRRFDAAHEGYARPSVRRYAGV